MFDKIVVTLLFILIFVMTIIVPDLRQLYRERKLQNWVSWIMVSDSQAKCGHIFQLWQYIDIAQHENKIKKEYRISNEQEWEIVKKILEKFQIDTAQAFFEGRLKTIKSKYVINGDHYFMLSLRSYLQKHQCDDKFLEYDMHKETISYKKYGCWGADLFDATYALTDFAMVYHKMYYIVHIFCKNCKSITESELQIYDNEEGLKEVLSTKQLKVSRY